jgi:UDP-GlcNAc:undecaprenyl-phosphate GlcNAc-1-phosphate transferase
VGAADDIWGVPAYLKLIILFGLTLLIGFYGVHTSLPFHLFGLNDKIMNIIVTMLWIAGMCSAINALDHLDALAGGVSGIAAIMYFIVSLNSGQMFWGLMSISLLGSLLGFLIYNKHPAKIFMGDSGSFFLGFSLASIGIMGGWSTNPIKGMIVPVAVLSVPIFDLAYVIISRRLNGTTNSIRESIAYCGKDHIGHRLMDLGLGNVNAVRVVYLIAATISISAITIRFTNFLESLLLLLQILMIYTILIIVMHFAAQKIKRLEQ